jgi:hypothetical protein
MTFVFQRRPYERIFKEFAKEIFTQRTSSAPIGSGWVGFEEYIRLNPAKMEMTRF